MSVAFKKREHGPNDACYEPLRGHGGKPETVLVVRVLWVHLLTDPL